MIKVSELRKQFGGVTALDGISFEIGKGEIVGFLGPNGAGKTTAMRIIAGYLSATAGSVTVDGVDIQEDPIAVKSRIGYLPEQPPLYPEMYVYDYLEFAARIKGVPKKDLSKNIEQAMQAVMIADVKKRVIRTLSKGYRQRVGIAAALVHQPKILILDEPTVGLDPAQIIEVRKLIESLKADDRTLLLSTHILPEVEQVCERIIIINKGRIAAIDSKEALAAEAAGKSTVVIEVARDLSKALELLASFDQVDLVGCDEKLIELAAPPLPMLREQIAEKIVASGCGLLSLETRQAGLEDIFIKLTRE